MLLHFENKEVVKYAKKILAKNEEKKSISHKMTHLFYSHKPRLGHGSSIGQVALLVVPELAHGLALVDDLVVIVVQVQVGLGDVVSVIITVVLPIKTTGC